MKLLKQNDGYALPFVLVVSVVMCIIATTVMTFSLNNLQSQQKTIERMKAKYAASSLVEEIIAATQRTDKSDKVVMDLTDRGIVSPDGKRVKIEAKGASGNVELLLTVEIELVDAQSGTEVLTYDNNILTISYKGKINVLSYGYSIVSNGEVSS